MHHNPHENGQPWRPPGGLYRARQCASNFFCPFLRSKPQTCKDTIALPDLLLAAAAATAPNGRGQLRRDTGNALDALACGKVNCLGAFRPARPAKF
eukprot:353992-Chlamydomonas_euryale.AAC.2